jgi:hypothetical protein
MPIPEKESLNTGASSPLDGLIQSVLGKLADLRKAIASGDEKTIRDQFDTLNSAFAKLQEASRQIH